uniref:Peptidase S1 domain-containing protein n=1 Tax=Romanomermis culicivorax TaxID=13658 RepID=A0A915KB76_ROMCU
MVEGVTLIRGHRLFEGAYYWNKYLFFPPKSLVVPMTTKVVGLEDSGVLNPATEWDGHSYNNIGQWLDSPSTNQILADKNDRVKRVIGPHMEESHSAKPWVVFLDTIGNWCGGFLLDPRTLNSSGVDFPLPPENSSDIVVTAAHCVLKRNVTLYNAVRLNSTIAAFGVHNPYHQDHKEIKFIRQSINVLVHEDFEFRLQMVKDIALIRLDAPVPFGPNVHPLPISTHSTLDVEDCMLTGYGPDLSKQGDTSKNPGGGDSGSPIVCYVNGTKFAHGVHSIGYYFSRRLQYANLFLLSPWLKSSLSELYSEAFFHDKLHRYLRYGLQNWNMPMNELEYIIQRYMGCLPKGLKMRLEDEKISNYGKIWVNNSLAEYVLVEDDAFNPHDLIGYTVEKNQRDSLVKAPPAFTLAMLKAYIYISMDHFWEDNHQWPRGPNQCNIALCRKPERFLPIDAIPDINVYFAPLPAKQIAARFSNRSDVDNVIFLDLEEPHHAGRPLMECNNENRQCLLLGLSSHITRGPNGAMVEIFLEPQEYLQWIEDTMKEAHIHQMAP